MEDFRSKHSVVVVVVVGGGSGLHERGRFHDDLKSFSVRRRLFPFAQMIYLLLPPESPRSLMFP